MEQPKVRKAKPGSNAWDPAPWELHEGYALQALAEGKATSDQQKAALRWIVYGACGHDDWAFRPGDERSTAIFLGRQFVAKQITKLINLNLSLFKEKK